MDSDSLIVFLLPARSITSAMRGGYQFGSVCNPKRYVRWDNNHSVFHFVIVIPSHSLSRSHFPTAPPNKNLNANSIDGANCVKKRQWKIITSTPNRPVVKWDNKGEKKLGGRSWWHRWMTSERAEGEKGNFQSRKHDEGEKLTPITKCLNGHFSSSAFSVDHFAAIRASLIYAQFENPFKCCVDCFIPFCKSHF